MCKADFPEANDSVLTARVSHVARRQGTCERRLRLPAREVLASFPRIKRRSQVSVSAEEIGARASE